MQLKLSQADLGKLMSISAQQIQRYESGENTLNINRLIPLANFLNVKPDYFLAELPAESDLAQHTLLSRGLKRELRVLLIEDDANDVLLFEKAVAQATHPVSYRAILQPEMVIATLDAAAQEALPDIILLDINMPRLSGIELLRRLKQSAHRRIPVMMLTNSVRANDMLACYEAHASGFIQKSTDLLDYYRDIDRIISYWTELASVPSFDQAM